ncbi:MAG: ABC transporter permease [Planctomycetota bacterium]
MYLRENPVLQRELLVNLRTYQSFILLAAYQVVLAVVVLAAWPSVERLDLSATPVSAKRLTNLFFLGQYLIASLIAPSFAAGTITGEKERLTYEMLLASPLRPGSIILGKLIASLSHLGVLVIGSLPIIVLCLPLGGISVYEVVAAYVGLIVSVILFGQISLFCSSYFSRTSNSLVVSYLAILPLVLGAITLWRFLESDGQLRLQIVLFIVPAFAIGAAILMGAWAAGRMLYPPDVGSEGKEVVDLETEAQNAIGLVIQPDQFPDRLFAPPTRTDLMADGTNPVYDKELRSEIFSQGTLMLRLVIQISMLLAIPLMGILLFAMPHLAAWFGVFVIVFNLLVGPVFLAGTVTGERERQTLDLLLTTQLTPKQILSGKFIVGFRIAMVLTSFLLWPLLLGTALNMGFYSNLLSVAAYFAIILSTGLVNALIAQTCSMLFNRTSVALLGTYVVLLFIYVVPPSLVGIFNLTRTRAPWVNSLVEPTQVTSPFSALFAVPLDAELSPRLDGTPANPGDWSIVIGYFAASAVICAICLSIMAYRGRRFADGVGG